MSRRVDRRLNNRTNYITNSRMFNAPYCAKNNMVSRTRLYEVKDISYRKASRTVNVNPAAVTGFRANKKAKNNAKVSVFKKISNKLNSTELASSFVFVAGWILFCDIVGMILLGAVISILSIIVDFGIAGLFGAFSWSVLWETLKYYAILGAGVWALTMIGAAIINIIYGVCDIIKAIPRTVVKVFKFVSRTSVKAAAKLTVRTIKGVITESKMIKDFTEAYIYYKAYRKACLLKAENTEKELEKLFK